MSEDEKLSLPSFEKMKAGIVAGDDDFEIFGDVEETPLEYETVLIDSNCVSKAIKASARIFVPIEEYKIVQRSLSERRIRKCRGNERFAHPDRAPMTSAPADELFYLANADDLMPSDSANSKMPMDQGLCRAAVDEIMKKQKTRSPSLAKTMIIMSTNELLSE